MTTRPLLPPVATGNMDDSESSPDTFGAGAAMSNEEVEARNDEASPLEAIVGKRPVIRTEWDQHG